MLKNGRTSHLNNRSKTLTSIWAKQPQLLRRLLEFVGFVAIGLHSWLLVTRIPRTLYVLFEAFRSHGHNIADTEFRAFGRVDAAFRPWYNKIARDYHTQGRFGYAWDDGLGMPLGIRIYNNLVTYRLLGWLGTRRMMTIGYLLTVVVSALLCGWRFNPWVGIAVGVLLAGSPLIVASYTHLGKPEVLWWGVAMLPTVVALSGSSFWGGLLWSSLAWCNLPVSVMLALMIGPALFVHSVPSHSLLELAAGVMPGVAKHALRGFYMWRSGFLESLASEQSHLWKRPWLPLARELVWWFPYTLSIAASTYVSRQFVTGVLIWGGGIGLHWASSRIIYLNDEQSFRLLFLVVGLSYAVASRSPIGLLAILLMAYNRASLCGIPAPANTANQADLWRRRLHNAWLQIKTYPAIVPLEMSQPASLKVFFDHIPDGTRFLAESDGDPRTGSRFRDLWVWTEEFLPQRQIDLVNEMYTCVTEPELTEQYLMHFTAEQMTALEMERLCQMLGVSYIVAYTSATVEALEDVGYQQIAQVDLGALKHFRTTLRHLPAVTLTLLEIPSPRTVIEPTVTWERSGNVLTWEAEAGQSYVVRYRYSSRFQACQDGRALDVEPMNPVNELPLKFMQVRSVADSRIFLKFHPRWI